MPPKQSKRDTVQQPLPRLGPEPYLELMDQTALAGTDRKLARMGLFLLWTSDNVLDAIDLDLSAYGLTESKLDLLLLLTLHQSQAQMSPSMIADRLGIRRASVTSLLDWTEQRGWIIREHNSTDRRKIHVRITEAGTHLVQQVLPVFWSSCASLASILEPEEQVVFSRIIEKIHHHMEGRLGVGR
ncbi:MULTISPECIES: MarR family winged helix-turn-helix transcriptional regulator [Paenibacillus]|jgi:DNA-binding MarR family transcriptional regulator|uniref:MarR family winged helix-turn-helix transcriptional regulator n=1 Tax=Paenibacillus TaxID=44249 RepID=UPI00083D1252|nr:MULTISPECIES: MarR family transcriptional regulator [Paenibacillus]MBP1173009.1 DNA-binding MarR family transcriptional regulator [Paenibacillus sp. PvR133]MXO77630.1 MarR family transcriptional regulator [Paenibacillus sp. OT2-17]ODB60458.1 transcriptional regulator [Paenibacillus polymyxa]